MSYRHIRPVGRAALLTGAALAALATGVAAKDLPASPDGAKKIGDVFTTYGGKAASAPPALVVTPDGSGYSVAVDIAAMSAPLSGAGIGYGPAVLKFKVFEQDDGAWRIEQSELPPIVAHAKQGDVIVDSSIATSGVHGVVVFDPALAWVRSAQGKIDKVTVNQRGPGADSTIEIGSLEVSGAGKGAADGAVSFDGHETFGPIAMKMSIDPKAAGSKADANAQPFDIKVQAERADVGVKVGGLRIRPLLDLWAFLVAHPTRAELAAQEATLKKLALAALVGQPSVGQEGGMPKLTVQSPQGPFVLEGVKGAFAVAAAGPASRYEQHLAATNLTLPSGLLPAMYRDLVPNAFDIGWKISGFDPMAAGAEAIADMHLAGDAPPISAEDSEKVFAKLIGAGPVVLDIPPSRVTAPQLDLAFEGKVTYDKGKPTGAITLHMRNFDKSMAALRALGPDAEKEMIPVLTMAKGLAKTEPGGVLTWVAEVGADRVIKVNGLPLGKSPY